MCQEKSYRQHPNFRTAERNRAYFDLLIQSDSSYHLWEWLLTILFYSALHYMKTLLSLVHGKPPNTITTHKAISNELGRLKKSKILPKQIQQDYEKFANYSRIARYHYLENYDDWNDPDFVRLVKFDCTSKLERIRSFVLQEILSVQ